jgi:hypothetical protein
MCQSTSIDIGYLLFLKIPVLYRFDTGITGNVPVLYRETVILSEYVSKYIY